MKILVLGSGVIGVTSAWYLARAGHEVTLVDRQPQPAMETSFANGGQVSWGAANPWAAPGIPRKALGWLFQRHAPLVLRPRLDPDMWRWLGQMLRNCTHARYLANKERQLRLARYSHALPHRAAQRNRPALRPEHTRPAGALSQSIGSRHRDPRGATARSSRDCVSISRPRGLRRTRTGTRDSQQDRGRNAVSGR